MGGVCVQRNLGLIVLVCTILYAIPRTAILGVILTTASWAVLSASIFVSERQVSATTYQFAFGHLDLESLYLRDERLRSLLPIRSPIG